MIPASCRRWVVVLATGMLASALQARPAASAVGKNTTVTAGLRVQVDKAKVDLKEHRLEVRMSRPAGQVKVEVYSQSDALLAEAVHDFAGRPAGSPLAVTWTPSGDDPVGRIAIKAYDDRGSWVAVEISPWFVAVPHEDVNFMTDSADIQQQEEPKLEAAFAKIEEVLAKDRAHGRMHPGITLYVAGHTDTVGAAAHNLKLSQERARSIASWFKKRGVRVPLAYDGFGETALAVKTADNVDELRNRRADYILSDGPPTFSTSLRPSWKKVP